MALYPSSTLNSAHSGSAAVCGTALTEIWEPPVANRFYNFWAGTAKDYNDNDTVTNNPIFCAKFDANGKVVNQTYPAYNVQTAANGDLVGRNVYGFIGNII